MGDMKVGKQALQFDRSGCTSNRRFSQRRYVFPYNTFDAGEMLLGRCGRAPALLCETKDMVLERCTDVACACT